MFEKLEERIVIEGEIVTLSNLHVGTGGDTRPNQIDNPVIKLPTGETYIPGSSIKGVLRCENDRLMNSISELLPNQELKVCDLEQSPEPCGQCVSCLLFGGKTASSIKVNDFISETKKTYKRDGVSISRKTRKAISGRKYDVEVAPRGTIYKGTIIIENPKFGKQQYAKLGGLLTLIHFFNNSNRALGGATSRGFGEAIILPKIIKSFKAQDYLDCTTGTVLLSFQNSPNQNRRLSWEYKCSENQLLKEIIEQWTLTLKEYKKSE
ncbi:MAG: RAMP superfamily CRISPR-associated protein [Candidatus Heimdallarchaeaceae archaeon]